MSGRRGMKKRGRLFALLSVVTAIAEILTL
jgi:hypothetical protein